MGPKMMRIGLPVAAVMAAVLWSGLGGSPALAGHPKASSSDLFYNYYVPPGSPWGVGAEMYLCPRPTPPLVGHTYITYQPLLPHEFLYKHCRSYKTHHPAGGCQPPHAKGAHCTHTCVHWGGTQIPAKLHHFFVGPD